MHINQTNNTSGGDVNNNFSFEGNSVQSQGDHSKIEIQKEEGLVESIKKIFRSIKAFFGKK